MKAGELLKQIEKHILDDDARIRISCKFNKLKVYYILTSITPIYFNDGRQMLELSNHNDNRISLNNMCNKLRENSDTDIVFIIYDDEDNIIAGLGENDKFDININNIISKSLYVDIETK